MKIEEALYLPVKIEGFIYSTDNGECKSHYRTLDGEEVSSSFKAKTKEELLDQPKLVVPQFVADWYEEHKEDLEYNLYLYQIIFYDEKAKKDDFYYWMQKTNNPVHKLINMHHFGYTVEKEKLYTVEIPTNSEVKLALVRGKDEKVVITVPGGERWRELDIFQLTEQEIRKVFDWAWQQKFQKEVANEL